MREFIKDRYIFSTISAVARKGSEAVKLRAQEISLLTDELYVYKVLPKDLVNHCPTYKERNLLLNIAYYIFQEDEISNELKRTKMLPFEVLSKAVKVSEGFLKKWQDYIITYTLILSNNHYASIQEYIKVGDKESSKGKGKVVDYKKNNKGLTYRGIALRIDKKSVIVLTSSGEFFRIKKSGNVGLGEEAYGTEKKGINHYKFKIMLAIAIILLAFIGAYRNYNKVSSTVIFNCTSQIKLEVNRRNKVVYSFSPSEKGKSMIDSVRPQDKNVDECLKEFIEYAQENNMIPKEQYIITITGEPFKYGELKKTDEYIVENNVKAQINNAGSLHNVYESVQNNKPNN